VVPNNTPASPIYFPRNIETIIFIKAATIGLYFPCVKRPIVDLKVHSDDIIPDIIKFITKIITENSSNI